MKIGAQRREQAFLLVVAAQHMLAFAGLLEQHFLPVDLRGGDVP